MALFARTKGGSSNNNNTLEAAPEQHVYPRSDILNTPLWVGQMLLVSASDTMMASPFYNTHVNVKSDGQGMDVPFGSRVDTNLLYFNAAAVTGHVMARPNSGTPVPPGVRGSDIANRFDSFLRLAQDHLLGAP